MHLPEGVFRHFLLRVPFSRRFPPHGRCLLFCNYHSHRRQSTSSFIRKPITTLPPSLHRHLFKSPVPCTAATEELPIELPPVCGNDLKEHFRIIAEEQFSPIRALLDSAQFSEDALKMMPMPRKGSWLMQAGWTRYGFDKQTNKVPYPLEDVFFFDIEVCVPDSLLPVMAVALSPKAWYGWCSERLINNAFLSEYFTPELLIPIAKEGEQNTRVVIGHHIGFDRRGTRSPYERKKTGVSFVDTMSMAVSMFGMADHQVKMYKQRQLELEKELDADPTTIGLLEIGGFAKEGAWFKEWKKRVSNKSLADVYKHLYPDNTPLDKSYQDFFVKHQLTDVRENFQDLMKYCAKDVQTTAKIYTKLWPMFQERIPHPVSQIGMIHIGDAYLPINEHWRQFYEKNEQECTELKIAATRAIVESARNIAEQLPTEREAKSDLWLWKEDTRTSTKNDATPRWLSSLFVAVSRRTTPLDELRGDDVKLKSKLGPAIFGLVYGPYPIVNLLGFGYGFLVPTKETKKLPEFLKLQMPQSKKGDEEKIFEFPIKKCSEFVSQNEQKKFPPVGKLGKPAVDWGELKFYRLPHPDGSNANVGDVYAKAFMTDIESGLIRATRNEQHLPTLLQGIAMTKFWDSYVERINEEVPIWYADSPASEIDDGPTQGCIVPSIVPAGTVSRRSTHKLWVTLTNSVDNVRLGTGIKTMVQAPKGWKLVGADVDSQEQWIAALFGDASQGGVKPINERIAGVTPFSNMMLAGSKNDDTDLHSVVAKQLDIKRHLAKVLNYARLYGSGANHARLELMKVGMKARDAERVADELFKLTKGEVLGWIKLRPEMNLIWFEFAKERGFVDEFENCVVVDGHIYLPNHENRLRHISDDFEAYAMLRLHRRVDKGNFLNMIYEDRAKSYKLFYGGYESSTFNWLVLHSASALPRTPVLQAAISTSLQPLEPTVPDAKGFQAQYKRSIMNWHVQSSAVDFLHLMLVQIRWLCHHYNIDARFVISIHDEVRYMVREEDTGRFSLALMLAHLYVRAFMSAAVHIQQLPMSVAFFSKVDVDTVLRKEPTTPCDNPDGTKPPDGEGWTIEDVLAKTDGSLKGREKIVEPEKMGEKKDEAQKNDEIKIKQIEKLTIDGSIKPTNNAYEKKTSINA